MKPDSRFSRSLSTMILLLADAATPLQTQLVADTFGTGANTFTMDFVTIGNPGNASDGSHPPYGSYGGVTYSYRIGTYEVSRDMITKANTAGGLGIPLADMTIFGGNGASRPASGVSWNQAARFVNWLNVSQGFTPAYSFATQPGAVGYDANQDTLLWNPSDPGYNAANPYRSRLAHYFLPSENEWFKAAYYDRVAGVYYDYTTGSNTAPAPVPGGTGRRNHGMRSTDGAGGHLQRGWSQPIRDDGPGRECVGVAGGRLGWNQQFRNGRPGCAWRCVARRCVRPRDYGPGPLCPLKRLPREHRLPGGCGP